MSLQTIEEKNWESLIGKSLAVLTVSCTVLTVHPSQAAILWGQTSSNIKQQTNPFWNLDKYSSTPRSNTNFFAFDEAQNVTLTRNIAISNPANWDQLTGLPTLSNGLKVSSHFVYLWNSNTTTRIDLTGTLVFDAPIVGLMGDGSLINPTNDLFYPQKNPNNKASLGTLEGLSWTDPLTRDYATISGANNNVLTLNWSSQSSMDPLRVLTLATVPQPSLATVPEPLTLLGVGTALGFGGLFKRKLSTVKGKREQRKGE